MSARTLLVLALVLPLAGCTPSHSEAAAPPPTPGLIPFASCAELTTELRAAAKASVDAQGLHRAHPMIGVPPLFTSASPDGPDIVKSDGRRIVTLFGGDLRVVDASTKRVTGTMGLGPGGESDLLIAGDRALVLRQGPFPSAGNGSSYTATELVLVDISGAPRILSRYRTSATLLDARQVGDTTRIALNSLARIKLPMLIGERDDTVMLAENRKAIDAVGADAWLPEWTTITSEPGREVIEKGKVPCEAVSRPSSYSGRSVLSTLTIPLASASRLDGGSPVAVVAEGGSTITPTGLYLTNGSDSETQIFRLDGPDGKPPVARASATVPGPVVDLDALSEWQGHVRFATADQTTRRLVVRVLRADNLRRAGQVDEIGVVRDGVQMRFIGQRGYVRAARESEAVHILDLADPSKPRLAGTLPMPGSGITVQEVGPGRLAGVGHRVLPGGGMSDALVSLFDPAAPRQVARHEVPGGTSKAVGDSRAMLWWPSSQLLAVPIDRQSESTLVLRVTGDTLTVVRELDTPRVVRTLVVGDELWTVSDRDVRAFRLSTLDPVATVTYQA
ncbi:beta-propeller domain-containing protein [Actinoplanes sp. NBRC 103695]|uniref:beta-propeller domain-containing protein n=1 Tax=Actinoplanes sp. NBRC 103695 TaxID=3032202 RepID=UPI0024A2A951|nr:beta-propeller domain-containing protein [Actinoplanes sp. NBRC 103695]GLZ01506.1 hypothetical protein Acsp02_87570 [Actinoplanes sp. NBRC 103695]